MRKISAAVLQTTVKFDKMENIRQVDALLAQERFRGADLVTLPEMFCCPYQTDQFPVYAEPEGGPLWQACASLARRHHIYLAAGSMPERDAQGKIYNTAYVFDRMGHQIAKHRKMHLFDIDVTGGQCFRESGTLTAGDQITVFDTEFGRMGLCICYDFRFPELARLMVLQGAEILLVPAAFNMTTGPAHWETLFRGRAVDHQCFTIGTAPAHDAKSAYLSWGHSIVADPWGRVLLQAEEQEGSWLVELDLEEVQRVRRELPLLQHRRTDVYQLTTSDSL